WDGLAQQKQTTHKRRHHPFDGREHLPLRDVLADLDGHAKSGRDDEGGRQMTRLFDSELSLDFERYELHDDPSFRREWDRREFLQALGGGILVCLVSSELLAMQPPGQRRGRGGFGGSVPQEIGAWIHIGEDGKIMAYSGKVEIGQNIRTSLSQVVAEELRVAI